MTQTSYLSGRVLKRTLPCLERADASAPLLKRLLLPQGELAQFYDAEEGIHYIACLELTAGGVRANHYHSRKQEWIYLVRGRLNVVVEEMESKVRESFVLEAGDLALIGPGVAHVLQTLEPGFAIEFSPGRFDASDASRWQLL
jgi:mannose-6-phosphate isomerase-like protein (cupin superfamily)